jgi:FIMAH domain
LIVVLRRVVADRREDRDRPVASSPEPSPTVHPDLGERRLGWLAVTAAITVMVVAGVVLTSLPRLRGSVHPSAAQNATPPAAVSTGPLSSTPPASAGAQPRSGQQPGQPDTPPAADAQLPVPVGTLLPTAPLATPGPDTTTWALPTGVPPPTALPVPTTLAPPGIQAAIADLRGEIRKQVDAGNLDPAVGEDLQGKVSQVAREVNEGDRAAALEYARKIREKLGKYRNDGTLTSAGYQALVARVDTIIGALN